MKKKTTITQPHYFTVPEAAKLCGVSRNTLYTWVRNKKLKAHQTPDKTNFIRPSDLVMFMQQSGLYVPEELVALAHADEQTPATTPPPEQNDRAAVLVVDDDDSVRGVLLQRLKARYRVCEARTGYEALHILTGDEHIRVVLLDLRMPGQNGLATFKEIQTLRPDVRVIIISGYVGDVPPEVATEDQVSAILQKPVLVDPLLAAVAQAWQEVKQRS